jgi:RNA-binding protein NOB1
LIKNEISIDSLRAQADELYTIPSVISELKDEASKRRAGISLLPFLKLRSPKPDSVKFVTDFARKTGDLEVLSKPDIHLIALTYELECELNGGDWRLRRNPGQKRLNGRPPGRNEEPQPTHDAGRPSHEAVPVALNGPPADIKPEMAPSDEPPLKTVDEGAQESRQEESVELEVERLSLDPNIVESIQHSESSPEDRNPSADDESDGDSDGWITPSNLKKHQARDNATLMSQQPTQKFLRSALLTDDFAMQNVSLQINLNVLSSSLSRITHLKTYILRCHGCFKTTRQLSKQFCPSCGQPTLTRTSCSTDTMGNFRIHLRRNFQWNNRGNVYSIPKPVHGSASGKSSSANGGGKNGWGRDLILAEDQKEYMRQVDENRRTKHRDLMDEDYLPSILSGHRSGVSGRIKVGAGRNINSKKRK